MKLFIDRREGDIVVLQNAEGETLHLPAAFFYDGFRDGDVVDYSAGVISPLPAETDSRRRDMRVRLDRLKNRHR